MKFTAEQCIGVCGSEFYAFATREYELQGVPRKGELLFWNHESYLRVANVNWHIDGSVVVEVNAVDFSHLDDARYARAVASWCETMRDAGWNIDVPDDVTLPELTHEQLLAARRIAPTAEPSNGVPHATTSRGT